MADLPHAHVGTGHAAPPGVLTKPGAAALALTDGGPDGLRATRYEPAAAPSVLAPAEPGSSTITPKRCGRRMSAMGAADPAVPASEFWNAALSGSPTLTHDVPASVLRLPSWA